MQNKFKVGDSVQLKSGGPEMIVTEVLDDLGDHAIVWCKWFVNDKTESDTFPSLALKVAVPSS